MLNCDSINKYHVGYQLQQRQEDITLATNYNNDIYISLIALALALARARCYRLGLSADQISPPPSQIRSNLGNLSLSLSLGTLGRL